MKAAIISIGNELLNGRTMNSNATYIGGKLYDIGIVTHYTFTIRDEAESIRNTLSIALREADIVIVTGGLGPTHDDITKKVIADFFGEKLVFNPEVMKKVEERFRQRGMKMPEVNRNQALVPEGARLIDNDFGTAMGMHFQPDGKHVFVLPGVPKEMQGMIDTDIIPYLREHLNLPPVKVLTYRTTAIAESRLYELCRSLFEQYPDYEIAFLPRIIGVDIRVSVKPESPPEQLARFEEELLRKAGKYIYTRDQREIEAVLGELLTQRRLTVAVAESCSGGLIQDRITDIPGSSLYFLGGVTSYSNESKVKFLGVRESTLAEYGAVSEQTAKEMASGARERFGSDYGLSTTGIAGPGGATPEKPVGLIYVGLADAEKCIAKKFTFGEGRRLNKERAAQAALEMLRRDLLGIEIG